jgi:hydrophobe/amphiphile efflux-3 (HAE3) family protein
MDGVASVTSLTNIIDIKTSDWGIEIGKLIDEYELPDTDEELLKLRNRVLQKDMYRGVIVSEDETTTLVLFRILDDADIQYVAKEIKTKINDLNLPENLYFGGLPFMMNDISDLIVTDIIRLFPITFFLIALVLFIGFRTIRGVILPILTAGISIIWALGLMVLLGYELTIISNTIPIILLAVGSAYTIHVVNRISQQPHQYLQKSLVKAVSYIMVPVVLAAGTTMVGFISFVFGAYLIMIRDFGIFTALGVFFAFILSTFFTPAIVSFASPSKKEAKEENTKPEGKTGIKKVLIFLKSLLIKHPKYTLAVWSLLILISIGGIFFMKRSVNIQDYFKKNNPTRISEDIMQKKFGGSMPVYVSFKGDIQSPALLKMMKETQEYMEKNSSIYNTQSIADLIEEMNNAMGEGKKIPDEKNKIEQLWFLLEGQDALSQLVTDDLDEAVIQSTFASAEFEDMQEFVKYMDVFIQEKSGLCCEMEVTGMPQVYVRMDTSLINSQFSSLFIAIVVVLILVGFILRSVQKGIFATIPIVSTIIILFGFMGATGIHLDVATVLVASIALGIGIDYSIHIITHFSHSLKENNNAEKALEDTILISGKAITINVLSVSAGFLILIFSKLVPLQHFGMLVALSMIGSGLGALTLLPALLVLTFRKKPSIVLNKKQ